jgi:LmbE family N-acetylglucosaminyl deacetylase
LAVIAHPDDMEFGASAAVARWTSQGKHIAYCLVTSGEAGIDSIPPDECRVLRQEEQRRSCEIVGVTEVEFLGFPDGVLEYGVRCDRPSPGRSGASDRRS